MASEEQFWGRDPEADLAAKSATRARVVREALIAVAKDDPDMRVQLGLEAMAEMASDDTLAKLGKMLK